MWSTNSLFSVALVAVSIVLLGQVTSISAVYWPCKADPECNSVVPRTFCNDEGYCECPAGHVFSQDVSVCLTESLHGESCQEGVQCSHMLTGAVCSSNQCTCRQGLTYLQGRCRTLAPLHSECQVDEDCSFGFDRESVACHESKCQCANGFYERSENICRRILFNAGDVCTINADCQGLGPNHRCNNFKCEFTDEASQLELKQQQQRTLGVQTSIDLPKSQSSVGVNTSIDVPEVGQDDEDEAAKFGDACTETGAACAGLAHSECRRKQCVCRPGYYQRNGLCYAELGEVAGTSSLCATVYRDGKCVCNYDQFYQPNMRTCLKTVAQISNFCTAESQCSPFGDAYCHPINPRRCVCRDYAVEDKAQQLCVRRVGLKQYCEKQEDCAGVPNTNCNIVNNTCSCKDNYFEVNEMCRPGIQATCAANTDCFVGNSECVDEEKENTRAVQETLAEVEEDFEGEEDEADEETGLLGEIDAPKRRKQLRKQASVPIAAADSSSNTSPTEHRHRSILSPPNTARDEAKVCKCKKNFAASGNECLPTASFGDACEKTEQCTPLLGDLAECSAEGQCVCKEEAHFNYNKCNKKVMLGEPCKRVSECFVEENPEQVQCRNAMCQCGFNAAMDSEQKKCVAVSSKNSSSRPSPLKVITLLLIAAAVFITTAAIRDALTRTQG